MHTYMKNFPFTILPQMLVKAKLKITKTDFLPIFK